jgi:hypothetical protein
VTCRIQQVGDFRWTFCPVDPPVAAGHVQCVARARIVDDLNLSAPLVPVSVVSARFNGRSGPDGFVGLVGRPFPDLPAAQVAGTVVTMTLTAPGYVRLDLSGPLGAQPSYPDAFAPLDFGVWRIMRRPVEIRGRVTRLVGSTLLTVAGANIAVTAAVPVPGLAGAQPAPPTAASFLALAATTDAAGVFRLGPVVRALRLTLTAMGSGGTASQDVDLDYAQSVNLIDFDLP